jgi:hypothetical protein
MTLSAVALFSVCLAAPDGRAPSEAHDQLRSILEQPAFQRWTLRQARREDSALYDGARNTGSWINSVLDAVKDWMGNLLQGATIPTWASYPALSVLGVLKLIGWILLGAVLAYFGYLLYRAMTETHIRQEGARVLQRHRLREALEGGAALALRGDEWLAESDRLANQGEFRSVYRAMYLGLLSGLHDCGRIQFRANRTNWTYVQHFDGAAVGRDEFEALTQVFDDVWYGDKPANLSDITPLRERIASLTATEMA